MSKKYGIFRMRNGAGGNQVLFPETHVDAVHTTKDRNFINSSQLELLESLQGSPLLEYNSEEQKNKFNKLLELADNATAIQLFLNNVQIDDIKDLQTKMKILSPLLSNGTLESLLNLLNQPGKYDLAIVPGNNGQYYQFSVETKTIEEGETIYTPIYTPVEGSTTNPALGSIYTPQKYTAQTEWKVPAGVENLQLEIPMTYGVLVKDNSGVDGQIHLWTEIQQGSLNITKEEYNNDIESPITFEGIKNSCPYLWMTWNLQQYLKPILMNLYQKDDVDAEYDIFINNIVNFTEKISYRPIGLNSIVKYQPFIGNTYYNGHIESNGDNTIMVNQEITPPDINMNFNGINKNLLLNGEQQTIASILKAGEEESFEFNNTKLILEFTNPFVGKTLVATKDNDHFDLNDWKIKE